MCTKPEGGESETPISSMILPYNALKEKDWILNNAILFIWKEYYA